jgi:parallel beta-helix repeat protein
MKHKIEFLEARIAPATFVVTNTLDEGPGSLRQAILNANALGGRDLITFQLPDWSILRPATLLPAITDSVSIFDQAIAIDGSNVTLSGSGLTLLGEGSSNSSIAGLTIYGFSKAGIEIIESSGNQLSANRLGVNFDAETPSIRMSAGILVNGGYDNRIDGNDIGATIVGIHITGGASGTTMSFNDIGVIPGRTGQMFRAVPNEIGIVVGDATATVIGDIGGNRIAANLQFGVKLTSGAVGTEIYRNVIGTSPFTSSVLWPQAWGIFVDGARDTVIGNGDPNSSSNLGNVICKNTSGGIWIREGSSSRTEGNFIGSFVNSENPGEGNGGPGILLDGTYKPVVSSNVISDNKGAGIEIRGYGRSVEAEITGNLIGTDRTGTRAAGNSVGITVEGAMSVAIGIKGAAPNTIVASKADGIFIENSSLVKIMGNHIGYAPLADGTSKFGNAGNGIHLVGVEIVDIGSTFAGNSGNIITLNGGDGIRLEGNAPSGWRKDHPDVKIGANFIGTDGISDKGNLGNGVYIVNLVPKSEVEIGGSGLLPNFYRTGDGNVISSNHANGVLIQNSDNVIVIGNYIGTDFQGSEPLGNKGDGVRVVDSSFTQITGGKSPGIIAGNLAHGVSIVGAGSNENVIAFQLIGLSADGQTPLDNRDSAIFVDDAFGTTIGTAGGKNRVFSSQTALHLSGALWSVILNNEFRSSGSNAVVLDNSARGNRVSYVEDGQGNLIVSDSQAAVLIANGDWNEIYGNQLQSPLAGVAVLSGSGNVLYPNEFIIPGGGLFVDLRGDGPTANDPLDADSGPNGLLNSPVVHVASVSDGTTAVRGEYRGLPNSEITIFWYIENEFHSWTVVQTDDQGFAVLRLDLDVELEIGTGIRASALSLGEFGFNSSESSAPIAAAAPLEIVAKGSAPGKKPHAQLVNAATGEVLLDQLPFGKRFGGGVSVAAADVDDDGFMDLIATPSRGEGVVKIFSGMDGHLINSFWAGPSKNLSARTIAAGDLDGDGSIEVITGQSHTKGGMIRVHDAVTGVLESIFAPFGPKTPGRLHIALGDTDADGLPEIDIQARILGSLKRVVLDPLSGEVEQIARLVRA